MDDRDLHCEGRALHRRGRRAGVAVGGGPPWLQRSSFTPAPGWPQPPCLRSPPAPGWPEPPRAQRRSRRGRWGRWGPSPRRDVRDRRGRGRRARTSPAPGSPGTTRTHPTRAEAAGPPGRVGMREVRGVGKREVRGRRRTARSSAVAPRSARRATLGKVRGFTGRRPNRPAIGRTRSHERSI